MSPAPVEAGARDFPLTRWTRVLSERADPARRRALMEELCRQRWQPLYFYARRRGLPADQAEDAVQGLLVELIERDFLQRLDPERGRLRAYLKRALAHHLENRREQAAAQKRGGGQRPVDFASAEAELQATAADPELAFNREWALELFESAFLALEAEYASGARRGSMAVLRQALGFETAPSYAELASAHGMTVTELKSFVFRGRKRFRELVLERVADTVATPAEADAELSELCAALRS